jgi:thymidylate synthase
MEFEVGEHVWLNIRDFKMFNGLAQCFIAKYARSYDFFHKSNFDVYTLKLLTNCVAHLTFYTSKLKLFICDDQ